MIVFYNCFCVRSSAVNDNVSNNITYVIETVCPSCPLLMVDNCSCCVTKSVNVTSDEATRLVSLHCVADYLATHEQITD